MTETSWYWDGISTGDATNAPYSADEYAQIYRKLFLPSPITQGIVKTDDPNWSDNLNAYLYSASVIGIGTGMAIVDGTFYTNNAQVYKTITYASAYGIILLQKSFSAKTIRIIDRQVAARATGLQSMTKTPGVTWEIPLATFQTNSSAQVTSIWDERQFSQIGSGVVDMRQGGSATIWSTAGTTNYVTGNMSIQCGSCTFVTPNATVTFPKAFKYAPVVYLSHTSANCYSTSVQNLSATTFDARLYNTSGTAIYGVTMYWIAVGPLRTDYF